MDERDNRFAKRRVGVGSYSGSSEMERMLANEVTTDSHKKTGDEPNDQDREPPERKDMHDRFGDSFHELFLEQFMDKFEGAVFGIYEIEKYIEEFDYFSLEDNVKEGYQYELELAFSRVVVKEGDEIVYDGFKDWTFGSWKMPYDKRGTAFNPTVGTSDGPPIYFRDGVGREYMVGVLLRIAKPR